MTKRDTESRIIAYITDYREKWHTGPSIRDIQNFMGWRSVNGAKYWLRRLYEKELVTWTPHKGGTIRVTDLAKLTRRGK